MNPPFEPLLPSNGILPPRSAWLYQLQANARGSLAYFLLTREG